MGDVHRPALALAGTGRAAHELGYEGTQRDALGELVVDAAVGGDHVVVGAQVDRHRRRNQLLAAGRIVRRGDLSGLDQLDEAVIGCFDQMGLAVDLQQYRCIGGLGVFHGYLAQVS
ncbi:hypothetical protein D9M71_460120 [compost metagenome]